VAWPTYYVALGGGDVLRYQASPAAVERLGHGPIIELLGRTSVDGFHPAFAETTTSPVLVVRSARRSDIVVCLASERDDMSGPSEL
jgi:hypothetical protein